MAYIEIHPKSANAHQRLADKGERIMELLQAAAKEVLGVPDHDIIVELKQCTTISFNALALSSNAVPDVVVKIATSDSDLQPHFEALCAEIVSRWNALFDAPLKLEIWVSIIDAWGCNIDFG
jgi:hypothetical protein